jgi:hypothetical protein
VSTVYAAVTSSRIAAQIAAMVLFTGMRNATRPAKNKRRDVCRRSGIMSTTACTLNRFMP